MEPARGSTETLSVSVDIDELPLNQVTSTEMSLSTAVLMEISQMTDKFVPAYAVLLDKVTLIPGVGTADKNIINAYHNKVLLL